MATPIHYFEEDSIEGTLYTLDGSEYKPVVATKKTTQKSVNKPVNKAKQEPEKPQNFQFSLFDNFTETDVKEPITTFHRKKYLTDYILTI